MSSLPCWTPLAVPRSDFTSTIACGELCAQRGHLNAWRNRLHFCHRPESRYHSAMKLHLFNWNLGANKGGGSALLHLIDQHYGTLDGEFLGWICELPSNFKIPPLKHVHIERPTSSFNQDSLGSTGVFIVSNGVERVHGPDHPEEVYRRTYSTHFRVNATTFPVTGLHFPSNLHPLVGQDPVRRSMEAKDRADRIHHWLRAPDLQKFHPMLYRHITMGDFNDDPQALPLTDYLSWACCDDYQKVITQKTGSTSGKDYMLRYSPATVWTGTPQGSYYLADHPTHNWRLYDQITLCPTSAESYMKDSFKILRSIANTPLDRTLSRDSGQDVEKPNEKISDHFPVQLTLEI